MFTSWNSLKISKNFVTLASGQNVLKTGRQSTRIIIYEYVFILNF